MLIYCVEGTGSGCLSHVEAREQLGGLGSPSIHQCGTQGLTSGPQAWRQMLSATEPSARPTSTCFDIHFDDDDISTLYR